MICFKAFLWHTIVIIIAFVIIISFAMFYSQVDAMKLGLKEMKKEYKKVDIDEIEVW